MSFSATVAASRSARIVVPAGSILVASGAGELKTGSRSNQLNESAQTFGPFRNDVVFDLSATAESRFHVVDIHKNRDSFAVLNDSGSNHNISGSDIGTYIRMIGAGAKTVTFRPDATEALPQNGEWHIRNAAASANVTLVEGDGVTLNLPAGGSLVMEPGMTVTVKRVAADEFDVIGSTVAAA